MDEEKAMELLQDMLAAYREKKPTTLIAIICAIAWVATVWIIGKAALLLAIPATLLALIKVMD